MCKFFFSPQSLPSFNYFSEFPVKKNPEHSCDLCCHLATKIGIDFPPHSSLLLVLLEKGNNVEAAAAWHSCF